MCFDKTGTITEDGMRFKSVRACATGGSARFEEKEWTSVELGQTPVSLLAKAMATCHSLVDLQVVQLVWWGGVDVDDHDDGD